MLVLGLISSACSAEIREGHFGCTEDDDCPPNMRCASDNHCWTHVGPPPIDGTVLTDASAGDTESTDASADTGASDGGVDSGSCTVARPTEEFVASGSVCWSDGATEAYLARYGTGPAVSYRGHLSTACARWSSSTSAPTNFTVVLEAVGSACGNICVGADCETGHLVEAWDDEGFIAPYPLRRGLSMLTIPSRTGSLVLCRVDFPATADHIRVVLVSCR